MGMLTYDGLNGASVQSCKTDRLTVWKVPCLCRQRMHNGIFFLFMTEAGLNIFAWKMQMVCQYSFVYSKKVCRKKPKKKQKLNWNTDARNRTMPFA